MNVALIGWTDSDASTALSSRTGMAIVLLQPDDLLQPLPEHVLVVVLGPRVQETLDPEAVACSLERFGGSTLVARAEPTRTGWCRDGAARVGESVPAAIALQRARELATSRPLTRMSLADWIGDRRHELSPGDRSLLRLVAGLPRLRGREWAHAAGISQHRLSVVTRRLFCVAAGTVLREYRIRAALRLRARGVTMEAIAPVLGYASRASVSRALRVQKTPPSRAH